MARASRGIGLVILAAAVGFTVAYPDDRVVTVAVLGTAGLLIFGAAVQFSARSAASASFVARLVLWIALLIPLAVNEVKSRSEILASPLTSWTLIKGIAPLMGVCLALILTRQRVLSVRNHEKFLILFLGITLASTMWSVAPGATLLKALELTATFIGLMLLVRIQQHSSVEPVRDLVNVVHLLLWSVVAGLVVAPEVAFSPLSELDPTPRLRGLLPYMHPNLLGFTAAAGILCALSGIGPRLTRHVPRTALIALYLVILLLTRTRASLVFLVVGGMVVAFQSTNNRLRFLLLAPLAIAVGMVAWMSYAEHITEFALRNQDLRTFSTLTGRTRTWDIALDVWRNRPIVGHGFYSGHRFGEFASVLRGQKEHSNLDSMWVETLLNVGLVGVTCLAAFIIAGARRVFSSRLSADPPIRYLYRSLFLMSLVASFVHPGLQQPGYTLIIFGTVILGASLLREKQQRDLVSHPP